MALGGGCWRWGNLLRVLWDSALSLQRFRKSETILKEKVYHKGSNQVINSC